MSFLVIKAKGYEQQVHCSQVTTANDDPNEDLENRNVKVNLEEADSNGLERLFYGKDQILN